MCRDRRVLQRAGSRDSLSTWAVARSTTPNNSRDTPPRVVASSIALSLCSSGISSRLEISSHKIVNLLLASLSSQNSCRWRITALTAPACALRLDRRCCAFSAMRPSASVVCAVRSLKSDIVAVADALISSLPTAPLQRRAQSYCVLPASETPRARERRHGRPSPCSVDRSGCPALLPSRSAPRTQHSQLRRRGASAPAAPWARLEPYRHRRPLASTHRAHAHSPLQ